MKKSSGIVIASARGAKQSRMSLSLGALLDCFVALRAPRNNGNTQMISCWSTSRIAAGERDLGDTTTLADPAVVQALLEGRAH